jgi:CheY-like chemotaxis protein
MIERDQVCVILVVDDDDSNREILGVYLGSCGYFVLGASNGLEAVKLATSKLPHLIIMDLSMPVMDGYGAARLIREEAATSHIPIVAYTAFDSVTDRERAMKAGFNEFLTKPIDFDKLHSVLDSFLRSM